MRRVLSISSILLISLFVAGCNNAGQDVAETLARAHQYVVEGNIAKARVELQNALKANPTDPQVNLTLARLEDEAGNLQAAVPFYLRAAAPDAHLIEPQLRVAEILLDSDRLQDAAGRINATVGSFPGNASALAMRADLAERQGQLGPAKTDADAALQKDPINSRALAVLAMLDLRNHDAEQALNLVNRGLAKAPNDLRLLQVQAAALLTSNQPEKAVDALRSIVRAAPGNIAVQTAIANLEASNGKLDDAIAHFKAAVDASPANVDLQLAFIKFLASTSKSNDAASYIDKLITLYPDTSTYDLALAGYYRSKGALEQSKATLVQAEARLPDGKSKREVEVALAKVEADSGHYDLAEAKLNSVLSLDPQNTEALLFRADLSARFGRTTNAIADLTAVVRNDPVNGRAFQALATAYLRQGDAKLAVDAIRRAVAVVPGDENAQATLAAFLENAADQEGARDLMARVTLRRPDSPFVWIVNAQIAIDRKDWGEAARSLNRLREIPGSSFAATLIDGQMRAARGDNSGAALVYRNAIGAQIDFDPSLLGAFARASTAAGESGDAAQFLAQRTPALKREIQPQAWITAMSLQASAGHVDKADEAFANAVRLSPQTADFYSAYVGVLLGKNQYDQARRVITSGLAAGASRSALLVLRGWIDESAGDAKAAQASYKEALDANPLSIDAANNYGSLVADRQSTNIEVLADARARLSGSEAINNPSIVDTIAWLDYRLGRFEEARLLLTRINARESKTPQIRFHLAAVLLALGDRSTGLALLDSLKGLTFPGSEEARSLSAT
ncbi:tetratricopeptide repeat protein [Lichenifustis flavocetrariae]|uniref:Tetratricopeptide repeat protein n=1 Tax=Lichenifustis flavocetrariae TaxID=2949735 RepID=A0AA42CL37_9HYPH|nr:tetratricopeptide repeat protein [Lichenifustis flavocetrariae]MCW6509961.1 tetratricopeptide repeat protein [Lichenifustis flavocetrariae]